MIVPCIICGKILHEVWEQSSNNQPSDGVCAVIPGQYGSTVFDPMSSGEHLEINLCDKCLVEAGEKGRVLSGRHRKPVRMGDFLVGYEELENVLVEWHKGLPGYDDFLELEPDEDLSKLPSTVHIVEKTWNDALKLMEWRNDLEDDHSDAAL